LAALAVSVRLDAFTKVKKAIDDLIAALLQQKADEIKLKDYCVAEFNTNQLQTEKKDKEKKDLIALIKDLTLTIEDLTKAIETLQAEIADAQEQLKRAGEDREKANKEFQMTVSDARETQKMLQAALDILAEFYGAALLQQPAPAGFAGYKKSAAGGGVMGMLQGIIADAKNMEAEAERAEKEGQAAYEDFVKETDATIAAKNEDIANKSETKAKTEEDLVEAKENKEAALIELENLANFKAELHQECDFTVKNFDLRQAARDDEVEALRQAKNILSGAAFEQFLQTA
jgi:DNA repair exonuclease SbcCD ATPase subunit